MDFKTLLPDFNAIGKTDWSKPSVDTSNKLNLVTLGGAVLMLVFVFLPWAKVSALTVTLASKIGIVTWYGILGFIMALAALVGMLYKHVTLTFSAAVLGVVFGILGMVLCPSMTYEGTTLTGSEIKEMVDGAMGLMSLSHLGAILYTVAAVVTAVCAYLKITKK